MNLQSEIAYFCDLSGTDQARLMALIIHELTAEARTTYGPGTDQVLDGARLRFANEMSNRLARYLEQLLAADQARPSEEVVLRMLLAPRADKQAERLIVSAYHRALAGFDNYDATVTMDG
ncbi:MAG TPA: hypothetical protein VMT49_03100 [Steroidobacteraceae bacterium]|nr:hypothetical protein [Steroidobacteraceae bacterium]